MARIPDVTAIDRRIPTGQSPIAVEDVSHAGAGFDALSESIGSVQADFNDARERATRYEVEKAESQLMIQQSRLLQSASEDPDFDTVEERTSKGVNDSLGESSMQIKDNAARNEFIARNQIRVEESRARAREIATAKKRDKERSDLNQQRDDLQEYGNTSGDYQGAIGRLTALYVAAEENGHVSAVERQSVIDAAKHDFAKTHIMSIRDPEERIKALKDPAAKNIPADVRLELEQQAQDDLRVGKAQQKADDWHRRRLTFDQVQAEARKMDDPELREAAERRYDYLVSHDQVTQANSKNDLYDEIDLRMDEEEVQTPNGPRPYSYDDIPYHERAALSAGHRNNLKLKEAARTAPREHSDLVAYDNLMNAQAAIQQTGSDADRVAFRTLFKETSWLLNPSDQKKFSELTNEGLVKPEARDLWNAEETLTKLIRDLKYSPEIESVLRQRLNTRYRAYQEVHGKLPTANDTKQWMNEDLEKYARDPNALWRTEDRELFRLTEDERQEMIRQYREEDPTGVEDLGAAMINRGLNTGSSEDFIVAYQRLKRLREQGAIN